MAGINDTDIRMSEDWQLTSSSTGDVPLCSARDCFLQDIRLEAVTTPGEIFYNPSWGWGLREYLHREYDELTRLEISQRIQSKLSQRPEVDSSTIEIQMGLTGDQLMMDIYFRLVEETEQEHLQVSLDRVGVEVIEIA